MFVIIDFRLAMGHAEVPPAARREHRSRREEWGSELTNIVSVDTFIMVNRNVEGILEIEIDCMREEMRSPHYQLRGLCCSCCCLFAVIDHVCHEFAHIPAPHPP